MHRSNEWNRHKNREKHSLYHGNFRNCAPICSIIRHFAWRGILQLQSNRRIWTAKSLLPGEPFYFLKPLTRVPFMASFSIPLQVVGNRYFYMQLSRYSLKNRRLLRECHLCFSHVYYFLILHNIIFHKYAISEHNGGDGVTTFYQLFRWPVTHCENCSIVTTCSLKLISYPYHWRLKNGSHRYHLHLNL